jgi:hypothetical protein
MAKKDRVIYIDRGWQPVFIGFCPNEKAWKREMKRMGRNPADCHYPQSDGHVMIFHRPDEPSVCLITVKDGAENERCLSSIVGIIVHECTHVWQEIREFIGEEKPGMEAEAYALQTLTMNVLAAFYQTRGLPEAKTIGLPRMVKKPPA